MRYSVSISAAGLAVALLCGTAFAAETPEASSVWVAVDAAVVSDYRFRGLSLSDKDPAVQGGLTVGVPSGFYAGVWGSSIAETAGGADAEVDLLVGYGGDVGGGFSTNVGLAYYLYPGDGAIDYLEANASLSYALGPLTPTLGVAYAPKQDNLRDALGKKADNFYVFGGADFAVPGMPVTLVAQVGYETGVLDASDNGKWDWQLGGTVQARGLTFGLYYVDTNINVPRASGGNLAGAGILASISASF